MSNPDKAQEIADNNRINDNATQQEQGVCPKCGSENLNYETNIDNRDNQISYPFVCDDCGIAGNEYYNLVFSGITSD